MTTLVASLAFVLVQTPQDPDLTKPLTFAGLASPAKRVVAELATKSGLKLDVSPQVASEVLFIHVSNVPAKELLDRIALTVNGAWITEGDGTMRLVRPAANANREASAERQERIADLQKELKKYYDALNKKPATGPAKPKAEAQAAEMAMEMLGAGSSKQILALLQRISVADLVLPDEDGRVVFSSNPTRMQKLLPGNLEPIVAEMVAEHNREIAARKKENEDPEPNDEEAQRWKEFAKQFGFDREPKPIEGRPAKLLLIAEQQEYFGGLGLSLRLYDSKGKVVIEDSMNLGLQDFMEDAAAITKPKGAPAGDDKPVEFSATTKELNTLFQSFTQGMQRAKMSAELEAKLMRPDLYDPLSFAPSDSLASVAKVKKLNIVANLPDSLNSMLETFMGQAATVNAFLAQLEGSDEVKLEKPAGWLLVTPRHPIQSRRIRGDRVALAKLIAAAKGKGIASLDDIAAYALSSPSPMEDTSSMQYLMLFAPNAMQQGMIGMADWNALRLYGTMNVSQRQSLIEKGRIPIGNLMPAQQNLLSRMLFGSRSDLRIVDPNAKPREEMGFMDMMKAFMPGQGGNDYRQEPTEIMPTGLPPSGYLTGDITREPVGKSASGDPMLMFGALGADELALFRYFKEDPNMGMVAGMMPTIDRLRLGERTNIALKVFVAPDVALERMLQDHRIDPNGPVVALDSLPDEFKSRINKRYEAFKKSPMPGFPMGGGVRPPP